jgi:hypothetical protein
MMYRRQLVLAAFWLLSGATVAQEPSDPVREAILRDAQRYVGCSLVFDFQCTGALYDVPRIQAAGKASMRPTPERPSGEAFYVDIFVRYDNPADPDEPLLFRGSLQPGQRELHWQSRALRGFEWGSVYNVEIEVSKVPATVSGASPGP